MNKYKDKLMDDIESYLKRRCKHYIDKMDNILSKYNVGDDWADLPEVPLRQYNNCSLIVAELQLAAKNIDRIRIYNIVDETEQQREDDARVLTDMGR
jgi:hypothetical protein